jgi:hypothetical protein
MGLLLPLQQYRDSALVIAVTLGTGQDGQQA